LYSSPIFPKPTIKNLLMQRMHEVRKKPRASNLCAFAFKREALREAQLKKPAQNHA
jgi:hypothetical protein